MTVVFDSGVPAPPGPPRPRWRRPVAVGAGAAAVVAGTVLGGVIGGVGQGHGARPVSPATRPAVVPPAVPAPLAHGPVRVYGGGSRKVDGVPVGYRHTVADGVQAALNYTVAAECPAALARESRPGLFAAIGTPAARADALGPGAAQTDELARKAGADPATGVVLDPTTGQAEPGVYLYSDLRPEYGAYKVTAIGPDRVALSVWGPYLLGHGSAADLSKVGVGWMRLSLVVVWQAGDWRLADTGTVASHGDADDPNDPVPVPTPATTVAVPFAERARLVPGWTLTADASETPDYAPLVART